MQKFWSWYEKNYSLNLGIAAGLFSLQLIHLGWLTLHVVWERVFGYSLVNPAGIFEWLIILVDYTEIPALVTTSMVYLNELRKVWRIKPMVMLVFLNSQWLHILWITDEFVVSQFTQTGTNIPYFLAWIAIAIDYLELPVIWDTLRLFGHELKTGNFRSALESIQK